MKLGAKFFLKKSFVCRDGAVKSKENSVETKIQKETNLLQKDIGEERQWEILLGYPAY